MDTANASAAPAAQPAAALAAIPTMPDDLHRTLWALVEASATAAAAVCLFDEDEAILRLAAEVGLSDEGCRTLRAIRAETDTWAPPLQCVLTRRTYLLEDTAVDPAPPLVESAGPVACVACIPLITERHVWGSVVLVSTPPFTLTREQLRQLQPHVDDIAAAVAALHAQVFSVSRRLPALWRPLDAAAGTTWQVIEAALDRARHALGVTAHLPVVSRVVRRVRAVDVRVDNHLRQLDRMAQSFWRRLRLLELEAQAYEAEDTALRARLYDAEARASRERNRTRIIEQERSRLAADLDAVLTREHDAHRLASTVAAHAAADRESALRTARENTARAEDARATAAAELEKARGQLAALQADVLCMTETLRRAEGDRDRARAEVEAATTQRRHHAAALHEAREREAALTRRIGEVEERLAITDARTPPVDVAQPEALDTALRERLSATETRVAHESQRATVLEQDRQRLSAELAEALEREQRLREELAAAADHGAAESQDSLRRASELVDEAERARASAVADTETARATLATLEQSLTEAREEAQQARARAELLDAVQATATAEQERLSSALDDARACTAEATARLSTTDEPPAPPGPVGAAIPAQGPATARAATQRPATQRQHLALALLDSDPAWRNAASHGVEITLVEPGPEAGARIAELAPSHVVANMLRPGIFDTLIALRAAGCTVPIHACLAEAGHDDAVMLGAIEISNTPLDVDDILARLAQLDAARGARVLAAGGNVNAFISLREGLARAGYSVAIAWDAKQAADMVGIVRPQAAIIDLALPMGGGAPLLVQLAAQEPPPPTVFIPDGRDQATAFARAFSRGRDSTHPLARGLCLARIDSC
jgi:CheY-like chemotaxis protein